ncbi:MAG: ribosome small subunit-dependent GTPase A [Oscillospiraceae bacterium]|nr:ribosome small subunit-dependent GTPase A [Oscillospiraceae bacterium]
MEEKGLVVKSIGGLYYAESPLGVLECKARGIFRKQNISPYVGDNVRIEEIGDGKGVISEIFPRKNSIIRPPLANLDYLIFVVSTCEPLPNYTLLDKFIATAEYKKINSMIAVTKRDLKNNDNIAETYKNSGAEVFEIDYSDPISYQRLYDRIAGKVCAFTGNTGVGKSTLLNHIDAENVRATGEISHKLGRGRHTTRHVELFKLKNGAYIADTPGFSTFETNKYDIILKNELAGCFNEFSEFEGKCRFLDCSHTKERGCAIIEAVNEGIIPKTRHNSYVEMYEEAEQIKEWEIKDRLK